jgi:DNA (cytosine-5)-methyltransferase 1
MTLPRLAALTKIDIAYLSRVEASKVPPSPKLLKRLSRIFDVEFEELQLCFGHLPNDLALIFTDHATEAARLLRQRFASSYPLKSVHGSKTALSTLCEHLRDEGPGKRIFSVIDLFCGAGGFTRGLVDTRRFVPVWANDFDKSCVDTYNRNFGKHCLQGDINDILAVSGNALPKADIVVGGPPCQGFSLLNKKRNGDPRKQLWRAFMKVIDIVKPSAFVMENVPELLRSQEFVQIRQMAESCGYSIEADVLNAADFGVAQRRRRAIIIASRTGTPLLPRPTHSDPRLMRLGLMPWVTVDATIGDLPRPLGTELLVEKIPPPMDLHFGRSPTKSSLARYRCVPEGGNRFNLQRSRPDLTPGCWIRKTSGGTDLFGRLWRDRPAFTIRTEFFKPEKGRYLHPIEHRPITHREAARLQSFDDDFIFLGSKIEVARQIGNAVPPRLAFRIGEAVLETLQREVRYKEENISTGTRA